MFSLFISIESHPFATLLWSVFLCHSRGRPDYCLLRRQDVCARSLLHTCARSHPHAGGCASVPSPSPLGLCTILESSRHPGVDLCSFLCSKYFWKKAHSEEKERLKPRSVYIALHPLISEPYKSLTYKWHIPVIVYLRRHMGKCNC